MGGDIWEHTCPTRRVAMNRNRETQSNSKEFHPIRHSRGCLLYTSDAADE